MKIKAKHDKVFQPVTLTIVLETEEEFKAILEFSGMETTLTNAAVRAYPASFTHYASLTRRFLMALRSTLYNIK